MRNIVEADDCSSQVPSDTSVNYSTPFGRLFRLKMMLGTPLAIALLTGHAAGQDNRPVTGRISNVPVVESTLIEVNNTPPIIQAHPAYPSATIQQPQVPAYASRVMPPAGTAEATPCSQCEVQPVSASPKKEAPKVDPCTTSHKPVFYDNDFSYLEKEDYCGNCLGDSLKNMGRCGNVDVGGQLRFRYHSERGMAQQAGAERFQNTQNDFLLGRLRLYTDVQMTENIRFYGEGIYSDVLTSNAEYIPRGIDRNYGDLLNLFFDVKLTDNSTVRIGRQELLYGSQRLVSPLDWSNTRRTFEGVKVMNQYGDFKIDAFYTQFVPPDADSFDHGDEQQEFWGTYASYTGMENATFDLYYLGFDDSRGATGGRTFNTFGSRLNGSQGNWLYELEGMAQTGNIRTTNQEISAYAFTTGLGRKMADLPWSPVIWGYYDYASGDSPGGSFGEFNDLFPLGHKYLGFIDSVLRRNVKSPNVQMVLSPTKRLKLLTWYHNFQSANRDSTITSIGGTPAQDLTVTDFGNELDLVATFSATARTEISAGYSHLWAGDKILSATDADFFYLQWQTNF